MGTKKCNAYTPFRRHIAGFGFKEAARDAPEKSLVVSPNKGADRSNQGRIIVHHRGGGSRRKYRIIDFRGNNKGGILVTVIGTEYDPNRTADIVLICYVDGTKSYILALQGLADGMKVMSGDTARTKLDNRMPLYHTPVDIQVRNIELCPGKGGQLVRSAGNGAQPTAKESKHATLRLPSSETRMVPIIYHITIGVIGNDEHSLINIGRAGRKRSTGFRLAVHSSVMNPNDHPHGGDEGKCDIGRPGPCTPWGRPALGLKTKKKSKQSSKLVVGRRDDRTIKQLKEVKNI